MVEVGGVMRPGSYEEAAEQADKVEAAIQAAKDKVNEAQQELHDVCVAQYPVGSRVDVNVASRRSPTHEVTAVNEHGWLTLRNIHTGTVRGLSATSTYIHPSRSWYEQSERIKA